MTQILALIAGVVGLATAVLNYLEARAKKREQTALATKQGVRIVSIPGARLRKWPWQLAKWMFLGIGIMFLLFSAWHFFNWIQTYSHFDLAVSISSLIAAVPYYYIFRKFKTRPWEATTPVRHQTQVIVEAGYDALMDQCRNALRSLHARVDHFDRDSGLIEARTGWSWRSWGEKMKVRVSREGSQERYVVEITSDSRIPSALYDFGKNSLNVRRFIELLAG